MKAKFNLTGNNEARKEFNALINKETNEKEFIVRESWTPKQVFDYVVAAGRAQWAALQKAAKEAAKERK